MADQPAAPYDYPRLMEEAAEYGVSKDEILQYLALCERHGWIWGHPILVQALPSAEEVARAPLSYLESRLVARIRRMVERCDALLAPLADATQSEDLPTVFQAIASLDAHHRKLTGIGLPGLEAELGPDYAGPRVPLEGQTEFLTHLRDRGQDLRWAAQTRADRLQRLPTLAEMHAAVERRTRTWEEERYPAHDRNGRAIGYDDAALADLDAEVAAGAIRRDMAAQRRNSARAAAQDDPGDGRASWAFWRAGDMYRHAAFFHEKIEGHAKYLRSGYHRERVLKHQNGRDRERAEQAQANSAPPTERRVS
jgi:hypothetical protein